jgi:hypothetical protein
LVISHCAMVLKAQPCFLTSCSAFVSIVESCNTLYTAVNEVYGCICSAPAQFDSDVLSCYNCEVSASVNQSLVNGFQEVLNFCNILTLSSLPTTSSTGVGTITILQTVSPQASATLAAPAPTGFTKASTAAVTKSPRLFRFLLVVWISQFLMVISM